MRTYTSNRGIPLLYHGEPKDVPVLTVENYCKWYDLFLVHTDGMVETVGFDKLEEHAHWDETAVSDHGPNVRVVERMCETYGWWLHDTAEELITGRWTMERRTP